MISFQTILFAGEAAHPCRFGSVEGAIVSGVHKADYLTSFLRNSKTPDEDEASSSSEEMSS